MGEKAGAAALQQRGKIPEPIVCVVSGGNIAPALFSEILGGA